MLKTTNSSTEMEKKVLETSIKYDFIHELQYKQKQQVRKFLYKSVEFGML